MRKCNDSRARKSGYGQHRKTRTGAVPPNYQSGEVADPATQNSSLKREVKVLYCGHARAETAREVGSSVRGRGNQVCREGAPLLCRESVTPETRFCQLTGQYAA